MSSWPAAGWSPPSGPWVLHTHRDLGGLTDRWLDRQVTSRLELDSRILGQRAPGGPPWPAHWLLPRTRADAVRYAVASRTDGRSMVSVARRFPRDALPLALHAHYGTTASAMRRFGQELDVRLVASFYGYDATMRRYVESTTWRHRYGRLFEAAHAVLAEGPAMGARLERLGCDPSRIRVVRMPVDEAGLAGVDRVEPDRFRMVLAARFVEKKGFDTAIRAFGAASAELPDAELVIVGGGPLETSLRSLAAEVGVADRVTWAGRLPFTEFMSVIAQSSVTLHPSRVAADGDSEGGAPVTLMESQWLGVPSVVSDHDDLPYVAGPGGIVLPAGSVVAWRDTIIELARDRAALAVQGVRAREFSRAHHGVRANALARERIYAGG